MRKLLLLCPVLLLLMPGCSDVAMDDNSATVMTRTYCPDCGLTGICACDKPGPDPYDPQPDQTYTLTQYYNSYPAKYRITATVFFDGTRGTSEITNVNIVVYDDYLDYRDMVSLLSKSHTVNYNKVAVTTSGVYNIYVDMGPTGDSYFDEYPFGHNFNVTFAFRTFY